MNIKQLKDDIVTAYAKDEITADEILDLIQSNMDLINVMKPSIYTKLTGCSSQTTYSRNMINLGGHKFVYEPE